MLVQFFGRSFVACGNWKEEGMKLLSVALWCVLAGALLAGSGCTSRLDESRDNRTYPSIKNGGDGLYLPWLEPPKPIDV